MSTIRFTSRTLRLAIALVVGVVPLVGAAPGANAGTKVCLPNFVPADAPNVPSRIADCPPGTTFTFAAGVYRIPSKLIPLEGDVLIGAGSGPGGTEFKGSKVISGWTKSGTMWVHSGGTVAAGVMPDPCETGKACGYQDWLYQNGQWLKRVLSPCSSLAAGQFCIDYSANKFYLGFDPGTSLIEYGYVTQFLVGYRYNNVRAEHFSYDQFATVGGAIQGGAGWFVNDVHGHHNHACGISLLHSSVTNPSTVQNSVFDHNGYHGYCDPGSNPQVLNNEFAYNNELGFAHGGGWVSHGQNQGLITGNDIHDNYGYGLQIAKLPDETAGIGIDIVGNTIANNDDLGIRIFNACSILIDRNTITGNGDLAVDIANSSSNVISNNTISVPSSSDGGGVVIVADNDTGSNNCGPLSYAKNNTVTGNTITMGTVADRGNLGNINGIVNIGGQTSNNKFTANAYHVPNGNCSVLNWTVWSNSTQKDVSFGDWQKLYAKDPAPAGTCGA